MRKLFLAGICLLLVLVLLISWQQHQSVITAVNDDSSLSEKDILPQVLAYNDVAPSKEFRKGHVTNADLKNYLTQTDNGFCIKLSSYTNIPTPAIENGNIYVSGGFGSRQYYSFNATSGALNWAVNLDDDGPSSAAIEDGVIVFNTESCTIFACDLASGKQLWSYFLGDPLMSMPAIQNGIVFTSYPAPYPAKAKRRNKEDLPHPTHVMIAMELKSGKILWQKWIDSDVMTAPVAKDDLLYVATFSGAIYKFRQKTGEIIEAKATRATSAPVFSHQGELVYSQRSDNNGAAVSEVIVVGYGKSRKSVYKKQALYLDQKVQAKSKLKDEAKLMDAGNGFVNGAPESANYAAAENNIGLSNVSALQSFQGSRGVYANFKLYNTMGDELVCTDTSGQVVWKQKLNGDLAKEGGFIGTPPVYANGYVIVATLNGEVFLINDKSGELAKTYHIKDPIRYQPLAWEGWIYVTTTNGKLHAINTGNKSITGWRMWGGNAARTNVGSIFLP